MKFNTTFPIMLTLLLFFGCFSGCPSKSGRNKEANKKSDTKQTSQKKDNEESRFGDSTNKWWGKNGDNSNSGQETNPLQLRHVTKITDGDTFYVADSTEKGEKIRLIGVDAPESRNMFKLKKEPFGKEATEYLAQLIDDKNVLLEYDVQLKDQYKRTLAYVFLEDSTFVNAELVRNGYAMLMTVPPNVKYADLFYQLQVEARTNKRGLWAIEADY